MLVFAWVSGFTRFLPRDAMLVQYIYGRVSVCLSEIPPGSSQQGHQIQVR